MKSYLNAQEMNDFMLIGVLLDSAAKIRKGWGDRGNLTKEEHRAVKTAETYLTKFYESVITRLGEKESLKIHKRLSDFELKIMDRYTLQRMRGQWQEEMKISHVDRVEFEDWCEQIMIIKCKGCTKNYEECNLHDVFCNNYVPESSWGLDNCRYAYTELKKEGAK